MRTTVMRGGLTGAVDAVTGGRLITSGGRTTGTPLTIWLMKLHTPPRTPVSTPPATPPRSPTSLPTASGGSTIATATGGTLAATGSVRTALTAGLAAAWRGSDSGFGPGGSGAGRAPGATQPVTRNPRPKVCGETSGANIKQPISAACPVNPMAVVQTLLEDGS